jgi:hypothetical protein
VQTDLDTVCAEAGLWPDAILSGHAHLYQRFTRIAGPNKKQTPYIVAGSGGFAATPPQTKLGPAPITIDDYTLEVDPIVKFGYLTITCDAKTLCISFKVPTANKTVTVMDSVCVDLATGQILTGTSSAKVASGGKPKPKSSGAKPVAGKSTSHAAGKKKP